MEWINKHQILRQNHNQIKLIHVFNVQMFALRTNNSQLIWLYVVSSAEHYIIQGQIVQHPVLPYTKGQVEAIIIYVSYVLRSIDENMTYNYLSLSSYRIELYFAHLRQVCNNNNTPENIERCVQDDYLRRALELQYQINNNTTNQRTQVYLELMIIQFLYRRSINQSQGSGIYIYYPTFDNSYYNYSVRYSFIIQYH
ncbi:Conserved_hypothetical protein [Hexamita inflata]|uniref:Uncharacterized protein n=1 Tax=Hexamita inflata TaxID=28002 RepID=A0ABP1GV31_9EUKA